MGIVLLIAMIVFAVYTIKKKQYEKTEYYLQTKTPYRSLRFDKGRSGEFYTYKCLKPLDGYRKFVFNVYLPKENGNTTEIDIILLHESGIYVFESKNYSGWIFGTETQQYWTQTVPIGRGAAKKSKFLNPIIQNKVHLKWLQLFLEKERQLPFYSYIIFSDRCTLKDITLTSGNHSVVNRYNTLPAVQSNFDKVGIQLTHEEIDSLYEKLYPLTQIDEAQKLTHIENVHRKQQATTRAEGMRCPRCGGTLKIRTAGKGNRQGKKFLGCSNYPKCRYIEDIPYEPDLKDQDSHRGEASCNTKNTANKIGM